MSIENENILKKIGNKDCFGLSLMQRTIRTNTVNAQRKLDELERYGLIEKDVKKPWQYRVK